MNRVTGIIVAGVMVLLMAGCGKGSLLPQLGEDGRGLPQALVLADSLMNSRPDSALVVLEGAEGDMAGEPKSVRMRYQLLRHQAMNKAFVPFTTDSLMLDVTDYYDRHGTPNNRMLAHYLLGCVYRDLKEVPHAIDCFKEAITQADTTSTDYDIQLLGCVYSQMAWLYHQQLLLTYEIEARRKAMRYAHLSNDTLNAIYEQMALFGAYYLSNKSDSAEMAIRQALSDYQKYGFAQEALDASTMLMLLLTEQPNKLQELKQLIDNYDRNSINFNENHDLPPIHRQFYYYKGKYFESVNQLDSAEHYYRKVYHPDMRFVDNDPMYRGFLSIFKKRHIADSIAKYAQLYCMVNDSSIAVKDQQLTAQMAATYNYTRYQKEARENDAKAHKREVTLILFAVFVGIIAVITIFLWNRYRKNQQIKRERIEAEHKEMLNRLREEHRKASEAYADKLEQLQQAERKHQRTINTIKNELGQTRSENLDVKTENAEAKRIIEQLNIQYEEETGKLNGEIASLIKKVEEQERQIRISDYKQKSTPFLGLGIVKRVFLFAEDCQKQLPHSDMKLLMDAVHDYYPDLICDLNAAPNVSELGRIVCVLVAMHLQPNEITHLLNISPQQVGNLKKAINTALFHESTALTLYKNLSSRYKVPSYPKM